MDSASSVLQEIVKGKLGTLPKKGIEIFDVSYNIVTSELTKHILRNKSHFYHKIV
jgi:hypothetical protein